MHTVRSWRRVGLLATVVAVLAFGWAPPAWAPCLSCRTTSLMLPLAGAFLIPPDPCVGSGEIVELTGRVHVVSVVRSDSVADIYLNMAGVHGVGQTTGTTYIGTGANRLLGVALPSPDFQAGFTLEPTDRCASTALPLAFVLEFGDDGALLDTSTVSVGGLGDLGG
jgi:hypothetical protein